MKKTLIAILSVFCIFITACSEEDMWVPTSLKGAVWKLDTPMRLQDFYTYEVGRCVAFSPTSVKGWIGWNEDDKYKVVFSLEPLRDREDTYTMTLHTYIDHCYYVTDVQVVDGKRASFLLFNDYDEFYNYHIKGDNTLGTRIKFVYDRRY